MGLARMLNVSTKTLFLLGFQFGEGGAICVETLPFTSCVEKEEKGLELLLPSNIQVTGLK